MSHPAELIAAILAQVEADYPPEAHAYAIERMIPGTRYMPDILVSSTGGRMLCAVEIGYTRPEKLTGYRALGISDVRWYDKQGELHPGWETKAVRAEVRISGLEPDEVAVYDLFDEIDCPDCHWCGPCGCVHGDESCQYPGCELPFEFVHAVLVTDYQRFWLQAFCDKCGWQGDPTDDDRELAYDLLEDLATLETAEFGRRYGRRTLASWPRVVAWAEEMCNMTFRASDAHFVGGADVDEAIRYEVRRNLVDVVSIEVGP